MPGFIKNDFKRTHIFPNKLQITLQTTRSRSSPTNSGQNCIRLAHVLSCMCPSFIGFLISNSSSSSRQLLPPVRVYHFPRNQSQTPELRPVMPKGNATAHTRLCNETCPAGSNHVLARRIRRRRRRNPPRGEDRGFVDLRRVHPFRCTRSRCCVCLLLAAALANLQKTSKPLAKKRLERKWENNKINLLYLDQQQNKHVGWGVAGPRHHSVPMAACWICFLN